MPRREIPADHPPFAALPVRLITVGAADQRLAVHVAGQLGGGRVPVVCVPGYARNMSDFADFARLLQMRLGQSLPVVLLDLFGRGRSADRSRPEDYGAVADARDVAEIMRALAIERAVFVGQGHGGQTLMALAAIRPGLIGAAVLIDAGPVTEPRSLIRLRSNLQALAGSPGAAGLTLMLRRMLAADYPALDRDALDRLALRVHNVDARGRVQPLFDAALGTRLAGFQLDDVLVPQWQLFDLLAATPLMFVRTELTDQLPLDMLDEMRTRRPDAANLLVPGQGSPALLDQDYEIGVIAGFIRQADRPDERPARRA
jgi:pimeloyl-ACP methyl ester carboxylesterase